MSRFESVEAATGRSSFFRRAMKGAFYVSIALLCIIGTASIALEVVGWHSGARWKPEHINAIVASGSPTRLLISQIWADIKFLIQYGAYFLAAIALFLAVTQIKTIAKLMSDFIEARGPIYQLSATITNAESAARELSREVDRLANLKATIERSAERVEEAMVKLGDIERLAVSEAPTQQAISQEIAPADEANWERLRELWNANGRRLDSVIQRIPEKRRRNRYAQMSRRNYPGIINAMADDGLIGTAARDASQTLHSTFMSFKPRNRPIPDSTIGELLVLDALLDTELSPKNPVDAPITLDSAVDRAIEPVS